MCLSVMQRPSTEETKRCHLGSRLAGARCACEPSFDDFPPTHDSLVSSTHNVSWGWSQGGHTGHISWGAVVRDLIFVRTRSIVCLTLCVKSRPVGRFLCVCVCVCACLLSKSVWFSLAPFLLMSDMCNIVLVHELVKENDTCSYRSVIFGRTQS